MPVIVRAPIDGRGRCRPVPMRCRCRPCDTLVDAGLVSGDISRSEADNPVVGDQAVPAGRDGAPDPSGVRHMLRLQAPLPDATPRRRPTSSTTRIAAAKPTLGDRLFDPRPPLPARRGHASGPTPAATRSGCSVRRRQRPEADRHRVLRRALHGRVGRRAHRRPPAGDPPRPQRRLLDGRHGRHRPGRGGLGRASPTSPTSTGSCRSPT